MIVEGLDSEFVVDESLINESEEIRRQIREFLDGKRQSFDLNFSFPDNGLSFVLREVEKIPFGETRTYGDLADEMNTSALAVGNYCGRNPLPLIIPCHRVVGKNDLGGYKSGREAKKKLLKLEGSLPYY
jgi:methylated-DNA-[protein]-cysteine S-methyltransferase